MSGDYSTVWQSLPDIMNAEDMARALDVSIVTARRIMDKRDFPLLLNVKRYKRVKKADLLRWLKEETP
jgi:hypothetical protein